MAQKKVTKEELIAKAQKPAQDAMLLHPYYRGKMQTLPKCCIRDINDMSIWYSPGVAAPCKAIQADPSKVYDMTNKWNTVAVISDGTRVLGLGDIGPEAALPVMEGKALLFKYLGGVDAVAICLDTKDPDEIIRTVKILQPSFGGINLEDINNPKCFYILDTLRKEARIPVWHDDQQGTAAVTLAGIVNALKVVGKDKRNVKVAMIGVGAANVAIIRILMASTCRRMGRPTTTLTNIPGRSRSLRLASVACTLMLRVSASTRGLMALMRPTIVAPGRASLVTRTSRPGCSRLICCWGRVKSV